MSESTVTELETGNGPAREPERLFRLGEVPGLPWMPFSQNGKRYPYEAILRWVLHGLRGVRLRAVRVGGTWCTRQSWLEQFFEESVRAKLPAVSANRSPRAAALSEKRLSPLLERRGRGRPRKKMEAA